jgi:hypothetical protein
VGSAASSFSRAAGHPRGCERLHVAVDGSHGDLELPGELRGGQLAARLEQEKQRYEPGGAHLVNMTEDGLFVCKSPRHER